MKVIKFGAVVYYNEINPETYVDATTEVADNPGKAVSLSCTGEGSTGVICGIAQEQARAIIAVLESWLEDNQ